MTRVLFTQAARGDLDEARQWYREHAPHMVRHFRVAIDSVLARIAARPRQFPAASSRTRRALLQRFPYALIFREADDAIYVVAVFHTSRDPRIWQGR
jgi:plasmid stabilization system protein ParE